MNKIALFSYNFPHKKTQDFIFNLVANGYKIDLILAADPVQLNIKANVVRTKIKHESLIEPKLIAQSFNIPFFVVEHNSQETCDLLKTYDIDLAIISGARILKKHIIESCKLGVLNFHPALLPECKGLDSFFWSIENDIPMGVTSHLIDKGVDSGKIVKKQIININFDDTVYDLTERLFELQIAMLKQSIDHLEEVNYKDLEDISPNIPHNHKMDEDQERASFNKLEAYILKYKQ